MKFQENIQNRLTGRHKKSFDFVGNVKNKRILDIGCSFGWFEKYVVENGCKEIIGIDIDKTDLSYVNNQIKDEKAQFLKASVLDLSIFKKSHFDIVVMWEVLEHLPKNTENKAFQEINRVLKPGGILYISTPNKTFWSCALDPAWYFGHRHYNKTNISKLLRNSDFDIRIVKFGGGFYELISMILLYIFKWLFRSEIPFKTWFDKKRDYEYFSNSGFATVFVNVKKNEY